MYIFFTYEKYLLNIKLLYENTYYIIFNYAIYLER